MQIVLIDKFVVPEESRALFLQEARKSARFLRTLPGYVEGYFYEKQDGESRFNIMTSAVWESEEAFADARRAAMAEFRRIGFDSQEIIKRLKVGMDRAVYTRTPY